MWLCAFPYRPLECSFINIIGTVKKLCEWVKYVLRPSDFQPYMCVCMFACLFVCVQLCLHICVPLSMSMCTCYFVQSTYVFACLAYICTNLAYCVCACAGVCVLIGNVIILPMFVCQGGGAYWLWATGLNREDSLPSCPQLWHLPPTLCAPLVWVRFVFVRSSGCL